MKRAFGIGVVALALAGAGLLAALVPAGSAQSPPPTTTDTTATHRRPRRRRPSRRPTTTTDDDDDAEAEAEAGPKTLPQGVTIGGIHVGGLSPRAALRGRPRGLQLAARPPGRSAQGRGDPRSLGAVAYAKNAVAPRAQREAGHRRSRSASTSTRRARAQAVASLGEALRPRAGRLEAPAPEPRAVHHGGRAREEARPQGRARARSCARCARTAAPGSTLPYEDVDADGHPRRRSAR